MHSIFQISISRNTKCVHKVGFRKSSHILHVSYKGTIYVNYNPCWIIIVIHIGSTLCLNIAMYVPYNYMTSSQALIVIYVYTVTLAY